MKEALARVAAGQTLSAEQAEAVFDTIMAGNATPAQTGGLLMALRVRGETVEEIVGAARSLRAKVLRMDAPPGAIDTCGTGGDESGTYNISTAAAFVVAGAGVPVAKHGNRALSSRSGSADVLAALGVKVDADLALVRTCLFENKISFLMAPRHHNAMRHVAGARTELGTRTIFNLLGPLANPAGTTRQLMGVFHARWVEPIAAVLGKLGAHHAWVVHGADGLDELTTTAASHVAEWKNGAVRCFEVTPEQVGLPRSAPEALKGGDAIENARALKALLQGEKGAYRDIVVLNAAAALVVAGKTDHLGLGVGLAAEAIDSGKAWAALEGLVEITNR